MKQACRTAWSRLALSLLAPASPAQQEVKSIPAAPPRAEGEGPWKRLILRGVTLDRRHRRAARRARRRRHRGQPHRAHQARRQPGRADRRRRAAQGRSRRPRDRPRRPLRAARASSTCTATSAAPSRARRPSTCSSSGWATASPPCAIRAAATASTGWSSTSRRATRNEITAPRIVAYVVLRPGQRRTPIATPEAGARVGGGRRRSDGADGLKFFGCGPTCMAAALDEAKKHGLRTACHHAQLNVARINVLDSARLGLTTMEHWYGLPEALFDGPHGPGLPARLQLPRRAAPLRPGRPALEAGGAAGQRALERGDGRAARARLHARPDASPSTRRAAT